MLSRFFLKRPVFAWVIAIMHDGAGLGVDLQPAHLPVPADCSTQPSRVRAMYPGASAETVENTVTQVIEQKMTGLDDMLYMSSHERLGRAVRAST